MSSLPLATEKLIRDTIQVALQNQGQFQIILFGSYTTGRQTSHSDIDIAIKSTGPLPLSIWAQIEEIFENSDIPQKIDVVDYHRVQPEFQKIIDRSGIVLLP